MPQFVTVSVDSQIIIEVKRSQLELPLEDYYDESSIQLYLKHVSQTSPHHA
jgi:hypothetical protein